MGKPDALIKVAARYEVVKLISEEPSLEEIFLSYYSRDDSDAP
jgi:ABC-2 type transport system ATP-binding protein